MCTGRSREKPGTLFRLPSPNGVTWAVSHSPSNGEWQNIWRAASPEHSPKPCCPEIDLGFGHIGYDAFVTKLSHSDSSLTGGHIDTKWPKSSSTQKGVFIKSHIGSINYQVWPKAWELQKHSQQVGISRGSEVISQGPAAGTEDREWARREQPRLAGYPFPARFPQLMFHYL